MKVWSTGHEYPHVKTNLSINPFGRICLQRLWIAQIIHCTDFDGTDYRPPNSRTHVYNNISNFIETASNLYNEIVVVGDFNIDLLTNPVSKLSKIFQDAGFTQLIKDAIRVYQTELKP